MLVLPDKFQLNFAILVQAEINSFIIQYIAIQNLLTIQSREWDLW